MMGRLFHWIRRQQPGIAYAYNAKILLYNNTTNADSIKKYGALYNWYVVDKPKEDCPCRLACADRFGMGSNAEIFGNATAIITMEQQILHK
jgi:hypothetical protein